MVGTELKNGPEQELVSVSARADCHMRSWLEWRKNSALLVIVVFFFAHVMKDSFWVSGFRNSYLRFGKHGRESCKDPPSNY